MQRRIAHNAAAPDIFALQLELRFDQRKDHSVWSYQLERVRQDQSQRDERNIDHAKIDKFGNVRARKKSRVQLLHYNHTRIVPDFPRQLAVPNVHRINLRGAPLQKTIGESAS